LLLSFDSKEDLLLSLNEKDSKEEYLIIGNYKSLKKWSLIPLKSITVLLGPNSAGKSTIDDCIKLLSLLVYPKHEQENAYEFLMKLFEGYRSKFDWNERPVFGFSTFYDTKYRFINKFYDDRFKEIERNAGADANYKIYSNLPFIYNLINDKKFKENIKSKRYTLILDEIHIEGFNADIYLGSDFCANWNYIGNTIDFKIESNFIGLCSRKIPKIEKNIIEMFDDSISGKYSIDPFSNSLWISFDMNPDFFWNNDKFNFDLSVGDELLPSGEISELNYDIWRIRYGLCLACFFIPINTFIEKIRDIHKTEDLRGLNSEWSFFKLKPNKYYSPSLIEKTATDALKVDDFVINGTYPLISQYINQIISNKNESTDQLNSINKWLSSEVFLDTKYKLSIDTKICIPDKFLFPKSNISKALDSKKEDTTHYSEYGNSEVEFLVRLRLIDQNNRHLDFKNVGTGISQLIPILSAIAFRSSFIKQPEVHLHPKLQARLADCIIDALNSSILKKENRFFFIETHSEHLILRFLRRVRNSFLDKDLHTSLTMSASNISFVYFKPLKDETEIFEIRVDSEGNFLDRWPDGFFDERDEDIWS